MARVKWRTAAAMIVGAMVMSIPAARAQVDGEMVMCGAWTATIIGTEASDRLVGTPGDDVIAGLGGNDVILGRGGDDIICGGEGEDVIRAGAGEDAAFGGPGRDTVRGGPGADYVYGDEGRDRVFGGPGRDEVNGDGWTDLPGGDADYVRGDAGNDILNGGEGRDRCVGRAGFDLADLTCERSSTEAELGSFSIGGARVNVATAGGKLPDSTTRVAISGLVTDAGSGPQLCRVGIRFAAFPPRCIGVSLDNLPDDWAPQVDGVRFAQRLLVFDWPPQEGRVDVQTDSASFHGSTQSTRPSFTSTIPSECEGITDATAVRRGGAMGQWRADNPERFGGFWIARDTYDPLGRIPQGFPVLQVKGTEAEVQAVRDLLATDTLTPCVIRVNFSDSELRATFQEVSQRSRSLGLEGSVGLGRRIRVSVEVADRSTVMAVLEGIERRDLVDVDGRAVLLG